MISLDFKFSLSAACLGRHLYPQETIVSGWHLMTLAKSIAGLWLPIEPA